MSKDKSNLKDHPVLKYTYQFAEADKYVIATPMWNLSIPAILKAYFDYITVTGITFKYTENGAVGLLKNKKAVVIMTTGGEYLTPPLTNGISQVSTLPPCSGSLVWKMFL